MSVLSGIIGATLGGLVSERMVKHSRGRGKRGKGGERILRYHPWLFGMCVCATLMFFILAGVAFIYEDPPTRNLQIIGFVGFALFNLAGCVATRRTRLSYWHDRLEYVPMVGVPVAFGWDGIVTLRWGSMAKWWILELRSGQRVRVSPLMGGAEEFLAKLKIKAPQLNGAAIGEGWKEIGGR